MDRKKTRARARRLDRLERLADTRVHEQRSQLQQRQAELDAAIRELGALQDYRDSYRTPARPDPGSGPPKAPTVLSPTMLAHRQSFVARLCQEIVRLDERVVERRTTVREQRDRLNELVSLSMGLARLRQRQVDRLDTSISRDEQRRLDDVAGTQYIRAGTSSRFDSCHSASHGGVDARV